MSPRNVLRAEVFFRGYVLQVVTGRQYLRGFVGKKAAQDRWLEEKMEGWQASVSIMYGVAGRHLQTAYSGLQKSLQQE